MQSSAQLKNPHQSRTDRALRTLLLTPACASRASARPQARRQVLVSQDTCPPSPPCPPHPDPLSPRHVSRWTGRADPGPEPPVTRHPRAEEGPDDCAGLGDIRTLIPTPQDGQAHENEALDVGRKWGSLLLLPLRLHTADGQVPTARVPGRRGAGRQRLPPLHPPRRPGQGPVEGTAHALGGSGPPCPGPGPGAAQVEPAHWLPGCGQQLPR